MYPHFQKGPVPASLDKDLKWCHEATPFLDNMILLAPSAEWIKSLLNGKLPDRSDFTHYGNKLQARVEACNAAATASLPTTWRNGLSGLMSGRSARSEQKASCHFTNAIHLIAD